MNAIVSLRCRFALVLLATVAAATGANAATDPTVLRHEVLGRSALGRPIRVIELGDPDEARKLLIVGCIHGDEPAGIAIATRVAREEAPQNADVWIVPTLNPDGIAAHTRQNAHGVDLNRNFPWHWRQLGSRGYRYYSGPHPLSETESQVAARLILRLRPAVSIWFHQPDGVVDASGGDVKVVRRFAKLVDMPVVRLPRYPGSVVSWENNVLPNTTAFVVELHAGRPSSAATDLFADAAVSLASP